MTILALVTIGFSSVTRSAQRRTLDNQLNTQAFYSAESAVNDAKDYLKATPGGSINTCQGGPATYFSYNNTLDAGRNVGYTCVLVNSSPSDLEFSRVPVEGTGNPIVLPFESSNNSPIISFDVSWRGPDGQPAPNIPATPLASYPNILNTKGAWGANTLGMVRIDLAPVAAPPGLSRADTIRDSFTFFLYPSSGGLSNASPVVNTIAEQGGLLMVKCPALPCTAAVTLGNLGGGLSSKYMMRLQSLYNPVHVDIKNVQTVAPGVVNLINAQAIVDATGKANDVFRRIQVRLPLTERGLNPAFVIRSADSICKRMLASPSGSITDVADPACNLTN